MQCDPRHPAKRHWGHGGDSKPQAARSWGHCRVPASCPANRHRLGKPSQPTEGSEALARKVLQHLFCVWSSPRCPAAHTQQVKSLCLLLPALSSPEKEPQLPLCPQPRPQRTRDMDFSELFPAAKANDGRIPGLGTGTVSTICAPASVDNSTTFLAFGQDLVFTCPCSRFIALLDTWMLLLLAGQSAGAHHAAANASCAEPPRVQLRCGDAVIFFFFLSLEIRSIFS